ncbi:hypothetical protein ACPOLB_03295 [Rubrivivax sp. RP6-9]|uniref:hypothetical protein n=1 Tax=Rubrivivax sp. RP6-9 TaxID=3415750 RepID=UPI003CC641E5
MALRVRNSADPVAGIAVHGALASCDAARLLVNELGRYCNGRILGRSVLVAGYRGAGKSTLVDNAIGQLTSRSRQGLEPNLRPLPVQLLGPNVFDGQQLPPRATAAMRAAHQDQMRQRILHMVVLGLYAALSREVVRCLRDRALRGGNAPDPALSELAAEVEISLPEGPTPAHLRDFWRRAGALESGLLFPGRPPSGRGMRELAAMSGVGYAYQRVSGKVSAVNSASSTSKDELASGVGWDLRLAELAKPLAALGAGAAATAFSAAEGPALALGLGLTTALATGAVFRYSSSASLKDEEVRDLTYMPDTSADTLDQVLPDLLLRLKAAGLAPVIVVDELDKVDNLWDGHRLPALLDHFKKLFAERVFSCLLVNRDFIETLHAREAGDRYGRDFSYFTHRCFVSYEPAELHAYLGKVLEPVHG